MTNQGFDPTQVDDLIKKGTQVLVKIVSHEIKPYNSGNGNYLNLVFQIMEGDYKGERFFQMYNIWHPTSKAAVRISNSEMKDICVALGYGTTKIDDLAILREKPMLAIVDVEKSTSGYPDKNKLGKFTAVAGGIAAPTTVGNSANTEDNAPKWLDKNKPIASENGIDDDDIPF